MDNDALDSMDQLQGAVVTILERLRGFTPAAIEDGIGGGYARRRGRVLGAHDADQDVDGDAGVAACERADLGNSLGHRDYVSEGSGPTYSHGAVST